MAIINGLADHIETLLLHNADPRIITVDGYSGVDLARLYVPKDLELNNQKSNDGDDTTITQATTTKDSHLNNKDKNVNADRMKILTLVENAANEINELEEIANNPSTEFNSDIPSYPDKIQKFLLINGNNMQLDNVPTFSKHLNGKMEDIQEADNLRMIVKVQKPSLGEGMCLVNNIDKSF